MLQLQEAGLELLRGVAAPVHVVFAIGGSRCGKSTACNALAFGAETGGRPAAFETGDTFEPVTNGVDVAVRMLPSGEALVVADCEGAFHVCASSQSARGFGPLGILAYHLASTILHVSMGSIDERDIEALGFMVTAATLTAGSEPAEGVATAEIIRAAGVSPGLVLLVSGARYDLGDSVARRLLRPPKSPGPDDGRASARAAISRGFRAQPGLEALPSCDSAAYWPKVDALRSRLLSGSPVMCQDGTQASGADVAARLRHLVQALSGIRAPQALEPEPAAEALCRSRHLEPLVEEISRNFAAAEAFAGEEPEGAVEKAVAEFDHRVARLNSLEGSGGQGASGHAAVGPRVREGLVDEMRTRLEARLVGISQALAKGRQQAAARQPPRLPRVSSRKWIGLDVDGSNPGTPRKKDLGLLESSVAELETKVEEAYESTRQEFKQMRDALKSAALQVHAMIEQAAAASQEATTQLAVQEREWQDRLRRLAEERTCMASSQAGAASDALLPLQDELQDLACPVAPDLSSYCAKLADIRENLETGRLRRHDVGTAATKTVEGQLQRLREAVDEEGRTLTILRETAAKRVAERMEELRADLDDERRARRDRYGKLVQLFDVYRSSLEAGIPSTKSPLGVLGVRNQAGLLPSTGKVGKSSGHEVPIGDAPGDENFDPLHVNMLGAAARF